MTLPRYPKYKDSGVEWLGEVPEHWEPRRLGQIGQILKGSGGSKEDIVERGVPCVRYGDIYTTHSFFIRASRTQIASERAAAYTPIQHGDILFAASGEKLAEIGKSAVNLLTVPAWCGGDMIILRPSIDVDPMFMGYAADSHAANVQKASMGRGTTVKHIYPDELKHLMLVLPPISEQAFIAAFLDRETAKIDALVAEQERLVELLKEKRQAVISHAVTKGLDRDAPMKDSGVEWLGEVPAHWQVLSTRVVARVVRGASPRPAGDPRFFNGDAVPWVTVAEITKDDGVYLAQTEHFLTLEGATHSNRFPKGTLVYSNSGATLGVPKILHLDACANDGVVAFMELDRRVRAEFLFYYLASITNAIREKVRQGSGQPNLNTDIVKDLRFGLPPLAEQDAIVGRIGALVSGIESLTIEAQRAIELLHERRTALISAAVTGQIDVREAAERAA